MKKFTLSVALVMSLLCMKAQITLNENNVQWTPNMVWQLYNHVGSATPSLGENQTWDYSNLEQLTGIAVSNFEPSQNPDFPNSQYFLGSTIDMGNLQIPRKYYYGITSQGYFCEGATTAEYKMPLQNITGNVNDSLIFPAQTDVWEPIKSYLEFPCTYPNQWNMAHVPITNFEITVTNFGLNKTPGVHKQYCSGSREVVGWGSVVVPYWGSASVPYSALLIKYELSTVDSFFLAGQPAPAMLLGALGLAQGATEHIYKMELWRENSNQEIVSFDMDETFTTVERVLVSTIDIQSTVNNVADNELKISPNPATDNIYFNKPASFEIFDIYGKKMLAFANTSQADISSLKSGVYFVKTNTGFIQRLIVQ